MASSEHLLILEQGFSKWNDWRKANPTLLPDLSYSELNDRDLKGFNFTSCNLKGVKLNRAVLRGVHMRDSDLSHSHLSFSDLSEANLISSNLSYANIRQANLKHANLKNSIMISTNLHDSNLRKAIFDGADLRGAHLLRVQARAAKFRNANFQGSDLQGANLQLSVFTGANLSKTNLRSVNFLEAELDHVNLKDANLSNAIIVQANLQNSDISNCRIYGLSAWNVKLDNSLQRDLIISRYHEPTITVDNIEVGQFIYLLLSNAKIRDIIDTITSKVVLILGRFTPRRKLVLDSLREELRKHNYSPIIFDFGPPASRDLSETILILAHLARFIIVDITNPSSVPQELQSIIPQLSIPVKPIISRNSKTYGMFDSFKKYPWVLEIFRYNSRAQLIKSLTTEIIAPAEAALSVLKT